MRTPSGAAPAVLLTAAPTVLLTAVLLAGCGQAPPAAGPAPAATTAPGLATKPPAEILRRAEAALRSASSLRVRGDEADLWVTRRGAKGRFAVDGGPQVRIIAVGDKVFLRGRAFWRSLDEGGQVAELFGDNWVDLSSGAPAKELRELTAFVSVDGLADSFHDEVVRKLKFTKVSELTVRGVPVVRLSGPKGTLDVAATGKPYPLRHDSTTDSEDMSLSDYGKPVTIKAPADAIRPEELGG